MVHMVHIWFISHCSNSNDGMVKKNLFVGGVSDRSEGAEEASFHCVSV